MTDRQRSIIDSGPRTPDPGPRTSSGLNAVREAIRQMRGYVPGEQPQDRRYIKLNTNENPYPPSPRVVAAVRAAATEDLRLYPDPMENVLVGNGSDELLSLIVRACVGVGERVVFPYPTYSLYDTLVTIQEGEAVH